MRPIRLSPSIRPPTATSAWGSPIVVDGKVVAADASGAVYVRDAATGRTLLTDTDGQPREFLDVHATVEASPLVWENRILLGIRGGGLLCLETLRASAGEP